MNKVSLFFLLLLGSISTANADTPFAGPYLGLQGGYVNGDDDGNEYDEQVISSYSQDSDLNGGLFGLFAGYNYLLNNNFMIGLEAEFDGRFGTDEDTFQKSSGVIDPQFPYRAESNLATSIRARLGYLFNDKTLLFVTGGYAGIEIEREWFDTGQPGESSLDTSWHNGWTAGVGLERIILNNIAMKVEYRYSSYGMETASSQYIYGFGTIERQDYDEHTLRVGFAYLFQNPDSRHAAAGELDISGYYFGVTAGGLWGESDFDLYDWEGDNEGKHDDSDTALVGGAQLGYRNILNNGFMWGVEADYQRSNYDTVLKDTPYDDAKIGQEITDIITARIKAGKLVSANTLAYITGGYAFTLGDVTLHDETGHTDDEENLVSHGWTVGAGIEHSLNNNLSIKAEYLYLRTQGVANTYFSDEGEYYFSDTTFESNIFRIGLNYYF